MDGYAVWDIGLLVLWICVGFRASLFEFGRQPNNYHWKAPAGYSPNPASATSMDRSRASALLIVSSYSLAGTESATMPAPAWM